MISLVALALYMIGSFAVGAALVAIFCIISLADSAADDYERGYRAGLQDARKAEWEEKTKEEGETE